MLVGRSAKSAADGPAQIARRCFELGSAAVTRTQRTRGPRMDVSELIAIEEIKQVKARYFRAADEKDWHTLRGLFTDDARAWYPGPALVHWIRRDRRMGERLFGAPDDQRPPRIHAGNHDLYTAPRARDLGDARRRRYPRA